MQQSPSPAGSPAQPTAHPPRTATAKRRLSDAPGYADYDHGSDDEHDDDEGEPPARSKRSRPGQLNGALGAEIGHGLAGAAHHGAPAQSHKALSPAEKEQRRVARMIRNRNAAQASRDRKKEHTAYLERRCYELENLLRSNGVVVPQTFAAPPPIVAPATSGSSSASAQLQQHPKGAPPRSQRAFSVLSDDNQGRIADLEDDVDNLRAQLDLEQRESAHLRARLDEADAKLARLAHFAPDAPFSSPFSAEAVPDSVSSCPSIPSPGAGPGSASSSYAVSLVDVDIASTPPANESYLELDDRVDVSPVWSDWAKGAKLPPLPPLDGDVVNGLELRDGADEVMKPVFHHDGAEESALAFLDLSFLQDGPVTASC
ncbi:hypothetical protein JCM9279_003492 [Rhodotorula babjevae]